MVSSSTTSFRSMVGMVLQDSWLFSDTIENNIKYGNLDASEKEILEASRQAHTDNFIKQLPDGYESHLNEDTDNISQGQKQLLTIARTILSKKEILILDEATSNVDTRTEKFIQDAMTDFIKHQLEIYFIENPIEANKITDQVLINMRSRIKAEKTRQGLKESLIQNVGNLTNRIQKFVDCRSKDPEMRELFIVEGDSAMGACKQSRDSEYQAIMPVRGKILNCLKSEYDRIFKSDIITDLIKVIGCGVEVETKANKGKDAVATFDINSLRWNKIII